MSLVAIPPQVWELLMDAANAAHYAHYARGAVATRTTIISVIAAWTGRATESIYEDMQADLIARHESRTLEALIDYASL